MAVCALDEQDAGKYGARWSLQVPAAHTVGLHHRSAIAKIVHETVISLAFPRPIPGKVRDLQKRS